MNNKVCGNQSDYIPVRQDESRYVISYGLEEAPNGLYTWYEIYIYKKQKSNISFKDVKDAILADINAQTTASIISGFDYTVKHGEQQGTEVKVWLSKENQSDFHAMHSNADALTFPVKYKIGELADGTPVYEEFANAEEMHAICVSITSHILACQQAGWERKDAIDWEPYEAFFPQEEEQTEE